MNRNRTRPLKSKIDRLKSGWLGALERSVLDSAAQCAEIARQAAPAGGGKSGEKRLRDSFSSACSSAGGVVVGYAIARNPHAAYVEFGTGRRGAATGAGNGYDPDWPGMAAQPYMQPAADACRGTFAADAAEALRRATGGET